MRFLHTGEVRMLGTDEWFRPPAVRVVGSTSDDLVGEVSAGRFGEELHTLLSRAVAPGAFSQKGFEEQPV